MESINVVVDDSILVKGTDVNEDIGTSSQQTNAFENVEDIKSNIEPTRTESDNLQANKGPSIRIQKDHPKELIIKNLNEWITTISKDVISNACFVSNFEPKNVKEIGSSIAKRLRNRTWKDVASARKPSKAPKKSDVVRPAKCWSNVIAPTKKKKEAPSTDSEYDVEQNVQDIMPLKKSGGKKVPANVPKAPIDNISFHSVENVEKWKFVYQIRLALERELGKDAFECKEVMDLIKEAGLMKSMDGFGKCYEMLVKEFIVNISKECDNKRSKEFRKVYVRGNYVEFSPKIISRFMGRSEDKQVEMEVSNKDICREITAKQYFIELELLIGFQQIILPTLLHDWSLDETIKTCTEKKIILESLIKALTEKGIDSNVAGDVEEEEDEEDENANLDATTDE
ncbi:uncharacterized protein LOC127082006 [Lathyrus oleraceus]|uniref:uncharacterized protein LOC127082006 n=1 Tax=Pisum sativum TaxID=3888 RepID=UPI0021D0B903|nr:uncharacterized protein LOC127082006 [Pisum sativum]